MRSNSGVYCGYGQPCACTFGFARRKLLKVAVDWKELASMPVSVKMVKSPDPELPFYDFEEFEQLVEGAGKAGADVLAFVLLAGTAGWRCPAASTSCATPSARTWRCAERPFGPFRSWPDTPT